MPRRSVEDDGGGNTEAQVELTETYGRFFFFLLNFCAHTDAHSGQTSS